MNLKPAELQIFFKIGGPGCGVKYGGSFSEMMGPIKISANIPKCNRQCFCLNKILLSPSDTVQLKKLSPIEFLLSPTSSSENHLFNEDHIGLGIEGRRQKTLHFTRFFSPFPDTHFQIYGSIMNIS